MNPAAPPHAAWNYTAPWWLPGGHAQTIWASLFSHAAPNQDHAAVQYRRTRWDTPDGDFIDLDWLTDSKSSSAGSDRPLLVLFHGLEGNSGGHYAQAFARIAQAAGMDFVVPHFRGCSGEINRAPRAYHSGDYLEIAWVLARLRQAHTGPLYAVGISLGGNALLRWAQEAEPSRPRHGRCRLRRMRTTGFNGLRTAHQPRLQPPGLRAALLANHEAQGIAEVGPIPRLV